MKIIINDHRKIFAIRNEFSEGFPNLRIEFYARPSKTGSASSDKLVGHLNNKLLDCRSTHEEGVVEITPFMAIHELKDHFSDAFGLTIDIFRKSGEGMNPKPVNDKNTLEEENKLSAT